MRLTQQTPSRGDFTRVVCMHLDLPPLIAFGLLCNNGSIGVVSFAMRRVIHTLVATRIAANVDPATHLPFYAGVFSLFRDF